MAQFGANATRLDPYEKFKFRVKWEGRCVAGISKVSGLQRTTEVVKHREGSDPGTRRKSPGRAGCEAITLEREDFRRDLTIEVCNEAGQVVLAYNLLRCWPSEYQPLPDLDANADAVAIQALKLENEGWERDDGVTEPTEERFNKPV